IVPSSCHGVVFAAGNGKCQEMLSLRIVVLPAASALETSARPVKRSMSERMVSGETLRRATFDLLATRHLCAEDHWIAGVLLNDGHQARVEKSDLKQHEERQRAVDLIRQRVENGRREVQAQCQFDERLDRHRLTGFLL